MQPISHRMSDRCFTFLAGDLGPWRIESVRAVTGEGLASADRLDIRPGYLDEAPSGANWLLRGVVSNARYTTRDEQDQLNARQPALGRSEATCAALIPMSKNAAWWALSQDERRNLFEARGAHVATGLRYLPAIARRLHHGRGPGRTLRFPDLVRVRAR